MFGETIAFYVVIWNHPIETSIKTGCLFGVPGRNGRSSSHHDLGTGCCETQKNG